MPDPNVPNNQVKKGISVTQRDVVIVICALFSSYLAGNGCDVGSKIVDAIASSVADKLEQRLEEKLNGKKNTPIPGIVPAKPKPAPPSSFFNPQDGSVHYRQGKRGCSGSIIRLPGRDHYYLLSAAHCVGSNSDNCSILVGNRSFLGKVRVVNREWDCCLIEFAPTTVKLPFVKIAKSAPRQGDRVWHHGFGVNQPGNIERGQILNPGASFIDATFTCRLSSGDSGCGIFLESTGELVALGNYTSGRLNGGTSLDRIRAFIQRYLDGGSSWQKPSPPT